MHKIAFQDKRIVYFVLAVAGALVLAGVLYYIHPEKNTSKEIIGESHSILEVDQKNIDLGDVDIFGGKVEIEYSVANTGDQDVVIIAATTSCGCTDGIIGGVGFGMHRKLERNVVIPAGQSEKLVAIYDPLAHGPGAIGRVTRYLTLTTNSIQKEGIQVRFSANIVNP